MTNSTSSTMIHNWLLSACSSSRLLSLFSLKKWGMDHYQEFNMDVAAQTMDENAAALLCVVLLYLTLIVYALPCAYSTSSTNKKSLVGSIMGGSSIHKTKSSATVKTIRQFWNVLLAAFSLLGAVHVGTNLLYRISTTGLITTVCQGDYSTYAHGPVGFWMVAFLLSKVLEFGDTLLLILSHGKRPSFLHWFHHATVLPLTWRLFVLRSAFGQWFVAINYSVHTIMYTYFACNDAFDNVRFRHRWGQRITFLQCTQFVVDLGVVGIASWQHMVLGNSCSVTTEAIFEIGAMLIVYLGLFLQFADSKYGILTRIKHAMMMWTQQNEGTTREGQRRAAMPWQRKDLPISQRFEEATKMAALFLHVAEPMDMGDLYGYFKQARCGNIPPSSAKSSLEDDQRTQMKKKAWAAAKDLSKEQAQQKYLGVMEKLFVRAEGLDHERGQMAKASSSKTRQDHKTASATNKNDPFVMYPVRIAGIGSYLPKRIVYNDEVERLGGFQPGSVDKTRVGVKERRQADRDGGENLIQNAARAIRQACERANVNLEDIDLLVSGFGEHQGLPDDACLVQRELGLGDSGVPAFTVHSTCLSWFVGLDIAASWMKDGRYKCVVVFASHVCGNNVNPRDIHTAPLFGDGAAAVVLTPSDSDSAIHTVRMETYGDGADACCVRGCGRQLPRVHPMFKPEYEYFEMYPEELLALLGRKKASFVAKMLPGALKGLTGWKLPGSDRVFDIDWVVPHQASGLALDAYGLFNWPKEKIMRVIEKQGNCVSASMPLALCHGIETGKIKRGDKIVLTGTGAGVSLAAMILTY